MLYSSKDNLVFVCSSLQRSKLLMYIFIRFIPESGVLLKERICFHEEKILAFKSNPTLRIDSCIRESNLFVLE